LAEFCKRPRACQGRAPDDVPAVTAVAVSPTLQEVGAGLSNGAVVRIAVRGSQVLGYLAPSGGARGDAVSRLAFSPDGRLVATAHRGGQIRVHRLDDSKSLEAGVQKRISGLAFYDDRTLLTTGLDQRRGMFQLSEDRLQIVKRKFLPEVEPRDQDAAAQWNSLTIDPRTREIAATRNSGVFLFTLEDWESGAGIFPAEEQHDLEKTRSKIYSAFRFGTILVDGSKDGVQRMHDLENGGTILLPAVHGEVRDQFPDATGTLVFSLDGENQLSVTDAIHRRKLLAVSLPVIDGQDAGGAEFAPRLHAICKAHDVPALQQCVIATGLGSDQSRIAVFPISAATSRWSTILSF
jgi:hypothetical protein